MNWKENDLKVVEMREKIIELTNEFDKKYGIDIPNYQKKLDKFLNKKLRKESDEIFAEQIFMTLSPLVVVPNNSEL
ncbi:MAG: hypothetical protein ABSG05_00705 [Candidatus Pacearchaeota archaeon]|jgi:CRISPR/Cas system endoribonuclease Cas6 (RAMP superfamily)